MICEPSLWTKWRTRGSLEAVTDVTMLELDESNFYETISQDGTTLYRCKTYARVFVWKLNQLDEKSDLVDFQINAVDLAGNFDDGAEDHYIFLSHFKAGSGT